MNTLPPFDLHLHSKYSNDGEYEVSYIVEQCVKKGVQTFSLTDHNRVRGIDEAKQQALQHGLSFVPGIEVDCCFKGTNLHLLGYNISWQSNDFESLDREVSGKLTAAFSEMIANIRKLGFEVDEREVLAKAEGEDPIPELIAEVMLSDERYATAMLKPYMTGGARSDMPFLNFYMDYFAQGKPAYVHVDYMSFADAVALIRDNDGTPVVAHPGLNLKGKEELIEKLLAAGAAGMEVFNNYHTTEQCAYFAELTKKQNAIMTCGSDAHGKIKPLIEVGCYLFDARYSDYLAGSVKQLISVS